jgi:hypothetical protein
MPNILTLLEHGQRISQTPSSCMTKVMVWTRGDTTCCSSCDIRRYCSISLTLGHMLWVRWWDPASRLPAFPVIGPHKLADCTEGTQGVPRGRLLFSNCARDLARRQSCCWVVT